jgi:hypothetical protein
MSASLSKIRYRWRRAWVVSVAGAKLTGLLLLFALCAAIVAGMWWILTLRPEAGPEDHPETAWIGRDMPIFWIVAGTALTIRAGIAIARWWRRYLAAVPIVRRSIAITKSALKFLAALAGLAVAVPILWAIFPVTLRAFGVLPPAPSPDFDFLIEYPWLSRGLLLYILAAFAACIATCARYVADRIVSLLRKPRTLPQ